MRGAGIRVRDELSAPYRQVWSWANYSRRTIAKPVSIFDRRMPRLITRPTITTRPKYGHVVRLAPTGGPTYYRSALGREDSWMVNTGAAIIR